MPYEKYAEAMQRLEITKAYGKKVSEANKRAAKRHAAKCRYRSKALSAIDGFIDSIREGELWRSSRRARKVVEPNDLPTHLHSFSMVLI